MKNLYILQTLLVVLFSSVIPSWTFGQLADPIKVNVRNNGSSFIDQFPAASPGYTSQILQGNNSPLGVVSLVEGASTNTLKLTFTAAIGVEGSLDVIISYFTLTTPMHPVTKWYRFNISDELVITASDKYLVDKGAVNVPLDVLANDSITNGQLFLSSVSVSNAGEANINNEGDGILFTPEADFEGDTWLQYIACDSFGNCGEGNIHLLVRDAAVSNHLVLSKFLLNTESLEILTPFEDFDIALSPSHGTLTSDGAFGWTYKPAENFIGTDTFQVSLLNQLSRKYIVRVYHKNTNVHAKNDKFYVRPGLSVTFNVLNNDLLDYSISQNTNPSKGNLISLGNGAFTYTPVTGYRGVDKFTYTTCFQDSVYCETATTFIHVTDLEPDNQFSYELQTSKDLPLAIDYPIDYTDFSYIISVAPSHGSVVYYEGVQQIDLPCDTIEAYNMIVYEPAAGYTGPDNFEYLYCIQPSNICHHVKVDVNVIDHPEAESCPCTVGCVWPGDGNHDGRVDMNDLLVLGNNLGDSGPQRNYNNPEAWFGQHATNWEENGLGNIQHVDANGDGTITSADVSHIDANYYQTHDVVARDVQQKLPYQLTIIPVQYSLDSGDMVILDIALGNATYPALDVKGVKFSINMPVNMMDSASVTLDFHQDSWLTEGAPFISLGKVPWTGRIDGGLARAQGNGATGYGVIATTTFIIVEDIEGFKTNNGKLKIPVSINAGTAMDNEGTLYDIDGSEVILTYDLQSSNKPHYDLLVYPNPAKDYINVHVNGKTTLENIQLFDINGKQIEIDPQIDFKHGMIKTDHLLPGYYFVRANHAHGVLMQKIVIIR